MKKTNVYTLIFFVAKKNDHFQGKKTSFTSSHSLSLTACQQRSDELLSPPSVGHVLVTCKSRREMREMSETFTVKEHGRRRRALKTW